MLASLLPTKPVFRKEPAVKPLHWKEFVAIERGCIRRKEHGDTAMN
jgi:hypothetical protein